MNVFNSLTLKQIFWKTKTGVPVLRVKSTKNENTKFLYKTILWEVLKQIEWEVQNGTSTKKGVLLLTTLFYENFVLV